MAKRGLFYAVLSEVTDRSKRYLIERELRAANWNRRAAARNLGMSYRSLLYEIKALKITRSNELSPE